MDNAGDNHLGKAFLKLVLEEDVRADRQVALLSSTPSPGGQETGSATTPISQSPAAAAGPPRSHLPGPGPGGILRPGAWGSGMLSHWPLPGKAGQEAGRSQPESW